MHKAIWALMASSVVASSAFAQTNGGGITMSTDSVKAAAVEQHAQELKDRPTADAQSKPSAKQSASKKTKATAKHGSVTAKPAAKKWRISCLAADEDANFMAESSQRLLLHDDSSRGDLIAMANIANPQLDEIAASELAVDAEVE